MNIRNVIVVGFLFLILAISIGFATGNISYDDTDYEEYDYVDAQPMPHDECYWDYYVEDYVDDKEIGMESLVDDYRHDNHYLTNIEYTNMSDDVDFGYYIFLFDEYNESYHYLNDHIAVYGENLKHLNDVDEKKIKNLEDLDYIIDFEYERHVERYDELNEQYTLNESLNVTYLHGW